MELVMHVADLAHPDESRRFPQARDFDDLDALCGATPEFQAVTKPAVRRLRLLAGRFDASRLRAQLAALVLLVTLVYDLRQFLTKQKSKTNVLRLATARRVVEDLEALHGYIDQVALALDIDASEYEDAALSPSGWRHRLDAAREAMLDKLDLLAGNAVHLIGGLSHDDILAGLVVLKYEIDHEAHANSPRQLKIVKKAVGTIVRTSKVSVPRIPAWFVSQDDVDGCQAIGVENCYRSSITPLNRREHNQHGAHAGDDGTWNRQMQVVIRNIEADPGSFEQKEFLRATETWLRLNHANVVRLCGGCHIGSSPTSPAFVAYEDAITASFVSYFIDGDASSRRRRFWRLFYQIACGVQYLHSQGIKHGDLKCSNLVVSADGTAKVCDFVERESTRAHGRQCTERTVRWKAPECVVANGPDPSFEADVFALGLCLIEAWMGETPYGMQPDEEIESLLRDGHTQERPDGLPDSVWSVVERLCAFEPAQRPTISAVVELFREQADQEQREEEEEEEEAARAASASTDSIDGA